jgi:hypothetical protein
MRFGVFLIWAKLARKDFEFIDSVFIFITFPTVKFVIKELLWVYRLGYHILDSRVRVNDWFDSVIGSIFCGEIGIQEERWVIFLHFLAIEDCFDVFSIDLTRDVADRAILEDEDIEVTRNGEDYLLGMSYLHFYLLGQLFISDIEVYLRN